MGPQPPFRPIAVFFCLPACRPIFPVDRHQYPQAQQHGHLRRPAIAEQRQRDAHHGGKAHHHHQVDRDIEEDRRGEPGAASRANRDSRAGRPRFPIGSPQEGEDQQAAADQPPFLGHRREDEVGMPLGEIVEMALRAVEEPLAPHPPDPIAIFDWLI